MIKVQNWMKVGGLVVADVALLFYVNSVWLAAVAAAVSVFVLVRIMRGLFPELALSGAFLGIIASYKFHFQEAFPSVLPAFGVTANVFIGTFILVRSLVAIGNFIYVPALSQFAQFMSGGKG